MNISEINKFCENSLVSFLNIEFIEMTKKTLTARMPVNARTCQPMGYLHGGASLALAETVGSAGTIVITDMSKYDVFGMQVTGNHIAPAKIGDIVTATASIIHKGKKSHVWDVEIRDGQNKLISVARVTNAIVEKKHK